MSQPAGVYALAALLTLGIGTLLGLLGRVLLAGRTRLDIATTTLVGIVGSALGAGLASLVTTPHRAGDLGLTALAAVLGTVLLLLAVEAVARRRRLPDRPAAGLIAAGESQAVEFKASARYNARTGTRDERLEQVIARAVCGFLNADGGYLLVGVADDGSVVGLDQDYALVKSGDRDRYELWLRDLLSACLGTPAAALVAVSFTSVDGHDVATLRIPPSPRPVFLTVPRSGGRSRALFVRVGNSTRELGVDEALEYATRRWSRTALRRR